MAELAIVGTETEKINFRRIMQGAGSFFRRITDPSGDRALERLAEFKKEIAAKEEQLNRLHQHLVGLESAVDEAREQFMRTLSIEDFEKLAATQAKLDSVQKHFSPEWSRAHSQVTAMYETAEAKRIVLDALRVIERRMANEVEEVGAEMRGAIEKHGLPEAFNPSLAPLEHKLQEVSEAVGYLCQDNPPRGWWQKFQHLHEHV